MTEPQKKRRIPLRLFSPFQGVIFIAALALNLFAWLGPLLPVAFFKWLIPLRKFRRFCHRLLLSIYRAAVWVDNLILGVRGMKVSVQGAKGLAI